ncbi:MAG: DinB family protein [Gemmatimonadales bacterium]
MDDRRLHEITHLLNPPTGERLWYGGATPLGALRGVTHRQAAWKPSADRHSIWELTLHLAYWKYAVRRLLEDSPKGGFTRTPANWPRTPDSRDEASWKRDRALLKTEHDLLVQAVHVFDAKQLDHRVAGSKTYRYADLMFGIVTHDVYHVGQIQLLKRLYQSKRRK